jgi:hypothetical protein
MYDKWADITNDKQLSGWESHYPKGDNPNRRENLQTGNGENRDGKQSSFNQWVPTSKYDTKNQRD